jgi:hypothetical protein
MINREMLRKIPCYITDKKLGNFLINRRGLPVLSIIGDKYYFSKTKVSDRVFESEIPLFYKWFSTILEKRGGEEN